MGANKTFLEFLNKFIPLTQEEYDTLILPCIVKRQFEKKSIITHSGEIENYMNFIDRGLVRKYYKRENDEINTQISYEGHIIHAQESFHSRTPSEYTIEAIEPCELSSITYECLERIYSSSEKMQQLGRLVITSTMVLKDKWQSQLVKLSPRERFIIFVTKHPELMQRVPQKYLASYLNIKPETFSRFKHMVREHSKKVLVHPN
ncbi:MAG TPA: Crp/Fnr family transcriptional regulator [Chitinophagaceae bacterium]|nr:Crp/Fnr family transcriptional regulator [Chitinophagaceae bacterium]